MELAGEAGQQHEREVSTCLANEEQARTCRPKRFQVVDSKSVSTHACSGGWIYKKNCLLLRPFLLMTYPNPFSLSHLLLLPLVLPLLLVLVGYYVVKIPIFIRWHDRRKSWRKFGGIRILNFLFLTVRLWDFACLWLNFRELVGGVPLAPVVLWKIFIWSLWICLGRGCGGMSKPVHRGRREYASFFGVGVRYIRMVEKVCKVINGVAYKQSDD